MPETKETDRFPVFVRFVCSLSIDEEVLMTTPGCSGEAIGKGASWLGIEATSLDELTSTTGPKRKSSEVSSTF